MGNANQIVCTMSQEDIAGHQKSTVFDAEEIKLLWLHFVTINSFSDHISQKQFQKAMLFKDTTFLDRIFRVVDKNDDNKISFAEYVECLSILSNKASKEDKLKFSFKIYDFDGDGFISSTDLRAVMAATLREHGIVITRPDIDFVVEKTMTEVNPKSENMISFEEYKKVVEGNPHMLAQLTINISSILAEYSSQSYTSLSSPRGFASALQVHNAAPSSKYR